MKYRSYNSEIIIATTLLVDVFNDIIIDRRKHGLKRDFSKTVSLDEIVQQKIEIPCILGDRSIILKSLENEPGKYKLPLIILQNKSLKTDTNRMVDLHNDVFYQEDNQFSKLSVDHHLYRPQQISKKRGQPIIIDYDMTIIAKYKEDLDQIFSNWAVHFRPDVYVKWWHPRNKENPLTSQILWAHNISYDAPIEYNPQSIFTYKFTTSFSFKSWLFYGMHSNENEFVDTGIIKKIKLFPNKSDKWDENDLAEGKKDWNDGDDAYVFGDIKNENISDLSFYGMSSDQGFYNKSDDEEGLKAGKYMVENVFAENNPLISGDPILSNIKHNDLVGDFFGSKNKNMINESNKLFSYLTFDSSIKSDNQAIVKNVYFKGGFLKDNMFAYPPSGDFMFDTFYKTYNKEEQIIKSEFGQTFHNLSKINISYNINDKNLIITSKHMDNKYVANFKNVLNSSTGIIQEFHIESKLNIKKIGLLYHKEYNKDFVENKKRI